MTSIMMATLPFSNNKNSINHNGKKSNKNNSNHNSNNKSNNRNGTSVSVQGKSNITNVTSSYDHVAGYSFFDTSTIGSNNSSTSLKLSSGRTGPTILQKKRSAPTILNNSCSKQHKSVENNSIQSNGAKMDNERNEMILNQLSMLLHPIIDAKPTAAASGSSLTTMIPNGYNSYNHDSVKYHKSNSNSLLDDTTITNSNVLQLIEQHFKQQQVESAVIQLLQKQQQQHQQESTAAASAAAVYQQQQKQQQQQQQQHQQLREQVQRQLNDTMNLNNPINSASTPVPASATATAVMIQRLAMILQDSSSLTNCTTSNANPYNFSPSSFACKPLAQLPSPPPSLIGSLTKQQDEQQLLSFLQRCCNNTNDFVLVDDIVRNSTAGNTSVSTLMQLLQLLLACKAQQQKESTSCIPTQRQTSQHNQSQMMTTTTRTPSSRATTSNDNEQSIAAAILQTLLMANIEPAAAAFVAEAATVAVPAQQQQHQNATIKDILLLRALLGQQQTSRVGNSNSVEMKPKSTTSSGEWNNDGMIPCNTKQSSSSSLSSSLSQLEHFQLQQQLHGHQQQAATTAKLPHTLLSLCGALHDTVGRLNKLHNNNNSNQDSTMSAVSSSSVLSSGCGTMTTDTAHGATTTAQRSTTVPTPLSSLMSLFQQTTPTTATSTNSSSSYYNDGATNLSVGQHQEHHPSMFTPLSSISSSLSSSSSSLYFSITKEQLKELTVGSELVCPGVCGDVPDSLFLAMAQMKLCTLTSEDLVGKCKKRRIGEIGLCCKHCNGTPGSGRYFPSTIDSFLNGTNGEKIVEHAGFVCKCCPSAIAQIISRLYKYEQSQIVRKPYGTRKHFYMYAWTKMTAIRTAPTVSSVAATMTKPVVHCCSSNPDTTSSSAS